MVDPAVLNSPMSSSELRAMCFSFASWRAPLTCGIWATSLRKRRSRPALSSSKGLVGWTFKEETTSYFKTLRKVIMKQAI